MSNTIYRKKNKKGTILIVGIWNLKTLLVMISREKVTRETKMEILAL